MAGRTVRVNRNVRGSRTVRVNRNVRGSRNVRASKKFILLEEYIRIY